MNLAISGTGLWGEITSGVGLTKICSACEDIPATYSLSIYPTPHSPGTPCAEVEGFYSSVPGLTVGQWVYWEHDWRQQEEYSELGGCGGDPSCSCDTGAYVDLILQLVLFTSGEECYYAAQLAIVSQSGATVLICRIMQFLPSDGLSTVGALCDDVTTLPMTIDASNSSDTLPDWSDAHPGDDYPKCWICQFTNDPGGAGAPAAYVSAP